MVNGVLIDEAVAFLLSATLFHSIIPHFITYILWELPVWRYDIFFYLINIWKNLNKKNFDIQMPLIVERFLARLGTTRIAALLVKQPSA